MNFPPSMKLTEFANHLLEHKNFIIFGTAEMALRLFYRLKYGVGIEPLCFFDNYADASEQMIEEITVQKPCNMDELDCLYIISVFHRSTQSTLRQQLIDMGISDKRIIIFHEHQYYRELANQEYPFEIQILYYNRFHRWINWENPTRYTEKVNIAKVTLDSEPLYAQLADKYKVREWIKEKIGEEYLVKQYGVYYDEEEIDFEHLPNFFVLKANNASGRNIIIKGKDGINQQNIRSQLGKWLYSNYGYYNLQLQYKNIRPAIICDEYLEGVADNIYDYNIFCFHGKPYYIWCIKGSHRPECHATFYDCNWERQPFGFWYPIDPVDAPRPEGLNKMLELSSVLSKGFAHMRVDWYSLPDGRILFGEMTFQTWGGLRPFNPDEYDEVLGALM